jgi:hypothetical protein
MTEAVVMERELTSDNAMEQRARRAARRVGLMARKTRWRANTVDNHGGFMLIEPRGNYPVAGFRFDLTAEQVIAYCDGE